MKNFIAMIAVLLLASSCTKKYTASASAGKSTLVVVQIDRETVYSRGYNKFKNYFQN